MKIKIFTEAGYPYGLGHLTRCIRLKKILDQYVKNTTIYHYGVNSIEGSKYLNWLDSAAFDSLILDTDLVVIDSYEANEVFYQKASKFCKKLIVLDDTNRLLYPLNCVIINGALGAQSLYPKKKNYLAGIEYAIIDKIFFDSKISKKDIQNILITFGGSDPENMTEKTLKILDDMPYQKHIILPQRFCGKPSFKGNYYQNISASQMANIMKKCDVAISAGGGTLNELAMSKTPTLIIPIAQNQIFQSKQWESTGGMKITSLESLDKDFATIIPMKIREEMSQAFQTIRFGNLLLKKIEEIITEVME
ncbi:hypothetical protein [Helicobacter cappadocius]|uniref:Glycosyl transferase family 28 C-terminal domain-containing protein n=1 Tax=Helicobacter cappadocius TaxID=3063998 RepID=A0AA90T9U4_9HELI|nr:MULTISPECIES: hypothetical protein [unclassified Helicobacter]MDO7253358.1 hypothetical protein [Helicobacter sp. faydin-H75]MDP2539212.1 hypothetical protein [Helicobacter sp. faydin-H76]